MDEVLSSDWALSPHASASSTDALGPAAAAAAAGVVAAATAGAVAAAAGLSLAPWSRWRRDLRRRGSVTTLLSAAAEREAANGAARGAGTAAAGSIAQQQRQCGRGPIQRARASSSGQRCDVD